MIARSELLPHAGFDANDAVTRYNTKAQLGVRLPKCAGGNMSEIEQSVGVRDSIIKAFLGVFCRDGCREAEISEVPAIPGVSESAFHEQIQSKEELVSVFLKDRHAIWMRWFEGEIKARYEATGGGLEIIADVLQDGFEDPKCFGLAFINIVSEGGDFDHEPFACWTLRSPQFVTIHTLSARVIVPLRHRSG